METTSNGLNNSNDVETPQESAMPETENQMELKSRREAVEELNLNEEELCGEC